MAVGDLATDFELPDETGTMRRLGALLQDGPVALFWYPVASSGGCTAEACHFRDLAPGPLAAVLHATASYLFEAGDVIDDGDTISGPEGDEHWRCRHEDAMVGPRRRVLDVDPGEPYAAGRRERG